MALFAVLACLGGGFACYQLIGGIVAAQSAGPSSNRLMAWTLVVMAGIVILGWCGLVSFVRRSRAHQPLNYGATVGPAMVAGMPYFATLPSFVALGPIAGIAALVLPVVVGIFTRRVVAQLTAPAPGYEAPAPAASTEEMPAEVVSAAAGLGAHRVTFGRDQLANGRTDIGCGLVVAVVFGGIGAVLAGSGAAQGWVILCFVVAVAVPVVFMIGLRATRDELPERAWVFERGFVWGDRKRRLTVLPWSNVQLVRHRGGQDLSYRILHGNGARLDLSRVDLPLDDLHALAEVVESGIRATRSGS